MHFDLDVCLQGNSQPQRAIPVGEGNDMSRAKEISEKTTAWANYGQSIKQCCVAKQKQPKQREDFFACAPEHQ